ncbi:MAG: DUF2226 domain-containing protein [Candidatus Altiarchaeota archaeon]
MTEIKARLLGGVQEKKKTGAERLKSILEEIKTRGTVTESELAKATEIDKAALKKYIKYLSDNGLITIQRRFFRAAEISAAGGRTMKTPPKQEERPPEPSTEETAAEEPDREEKPPPAPPQKTGENQAPASEPLPEKEPPAEQPPKETESQKTDLEPKSPPIQGGEKVIPATEAELKEVCESLVTDFLGVIRLFGEIQGKSYTAGLLIDKGDIIASSFEHMDTVEILYGDEALRQMQEKFCGTRGDLEIYELSEEDLNESLIKNINYLLTTPIKLSTLKIKIKTTTPPPEERRYMFSNLACMFNRPDPKAKEERMTVLKEMKKRRVEKLSGGLNLVDFARNLVFDPAKAKRFEELRKAMQKTAPEQGREDPRKAARFEELKNQRMLLKGIIPQQGGPMSKEERIEKFKQEHKPIQALPEKLDKIPVKAVKEGKKIETNIDRFYDYVKSNGKLKLNDALSLKLKVSKTQLEAWAMILEEHSLLELRYPTIGEPEVAYNAPEKPVKTDDADGRKKR